jgi:hypothetical protein
MSFQNERLSQRFDQVLAEPAPPTTVDVGRLLTDGHRLLIRRRVRAAVAGAAVVALAGVLVPSLLPGSTVAQVGAAASPSAKNDPLTLSVSFGWLPSGVVANEYVHSAGGASGHSEALMANTDDGSIQVDLTTVPAPWGTPQNVKGKTVAGVVNGHSAYWSPEPVAGGSNAASFNGLVFQSRSGQWALLQSTGVSTADQLRIARGIAFGPEASPLPFQVTGLPVPTSAIGANLIAANGSLTTSLIDFAVGATHVSITAAPARGTSASSSSGQAGPGTKTASKTENGLVFTVVLTSASAQGKHPLPPVGDPASYLPDITSLGMDPADWTTSVVLP